LYYNWHRYYDPNTGRYFKIDPLGIEGDLNNYGYVSENPIKIVDPTGEKGVYYGNWCGPGSDIRTRPWRPPIDLVDAACERHDICYQTYFIKWNKPKSKQCGKRGCDRDLYKKLDYLIKTGLINGKALSYAKKARFIFKSSMGEPSKWEKENCCP
jgi:hypothetical protein